MNYPNKINKKQTFNKMPNYKNRGMKLENLINDANNYYKEQNIALIYKKPTPIKVIKTKYKTGNKQQITEAFYETKSTTDYNGLYKGLYIDFEAKETNNKNYFPVTNLHQHQIEHMRRVTELNGICFLIVSFTKLNEIYLLPAKRLIEILNNDKKKIELNYFKEKGYLIKEKIIPSIDYLKIVDEIFLEGNYEI